MQRVVMFAPVMALLSCAAGPPRASWIPEGGFVRDEQTAVKIAEAVLVPIYGEKTIAAERPLTARLKDDTWFVEGTFHCTAPPGMFCVGGTAVVKIARSDGQILQVTHGQ